MVETWEHSYDVVVAGTGVAALATAVTLSLIHI